MLLMIIALITWLSLMLSFAPAYSAVFDISSGDVTSLISAINTANAGGQENTINLGPGIYTLTSIDNDPGCGSPSPLARECGNGLPVITGTMTINGESAGTTIIERNPAAPRFRIFAISAVAGNLTLNRLTITGGRADFGAGIDNDGTLTITDSVIEMNVDSLRGGGINNNGTLTISRSFIRNNQALFEGGGIATLGTTTITSSTIAHNLSQGAGGVLNGFPGGAGTLTIHNSTISDNQGDVAGSITNGEGGMMTITNSTIANNITRFFETAAGITNGGTLKIRSSTVAGNRSGIPGGLISGIVNSGTLEVQNTIVDECSGPMTSLGNNMIADLTDCGISLLSSDLTGDPSLGAFVDDGAPGHGRFPLLSGSQAIDAGNDAACPATDQLGTPRNGRRDIGAIEFYPVVNNLVVLTKLSTDFDSAPVPGGPAGIFHITADFTNTSNQAIIHPFVEVVDLTGGNLLLNADGGAGGVGARLTAPDSATNPFQPGASSTFEFLIGLQRQEPFTFFVNMLGEPETPSSSLSMAGKAQTSNP